MKYSNVENNSREIPKKKEVFYSLRDTFQTTVMEK